MKNNKYNILFVITMSFDINSGGVQATTYKMAQYFLSKGLSVCVYSFAKGDHCFCNDISINYSIEDGGVKNKKNISKFKIFVKENNFNIIVNQVPNELIISESIVHLVQQKGIIFIACLRNSLFSVVNNIDDYITFIFGKKNVVTHNKFIKHIFLLIHWYRQQNVLKKILAYHDIYVMFGPPNIVELEYFVGNYKKNKWRFIPNSIPNVYKAGLNKSNKILWLSRLSYNQKRADLILPIWKNIYKHLPDWELDVVGYGDAYEDLIKQSNEENIPRIKFYGKQKPDEYYRRSKIYIMTSSFEGFPNTVIEAQSYKAVPVLFNSYPVIEWLIENNSGILIEPFNIAEFAEKVIELANNEDRLTEMAEKAVQNANKYVINKVGNKWLELFEELMVIKNK